jgi:hypothetical protein
MIETTRSTTAFTHLYLSWHPSDHEELSWH